MHRATATEDPIAKVLKILQNGSKIVSRTLETNYGEQTIYCWKLLNEDECMIKIKGEM